MSDIISLGALNKITGEYVYPKIANKIDKYICPDCNKDLIVCKGDIRVHHFRHKVDSINPCNHYSSPTEAQIHKDAKRLLKHLLEKKIKVSFIRKCIKCEECEEFEIPEITEKSVIELEYRFEFNGVKIADVAYIDSKEIVCIFEICNTHKTSRENRPEPWFEIDAESLIKIANDIKTTSIKMECIRNNKCEDCTKEEKISKIEVLMNDIKISNNGNKINQRKRHEYIFELLHNNIIIDNIKELQSNETNYHINITHPLLKQRIDYHTKYNHVYLYKDKDKIIHGRGFAGVYYIKEIIEWYKCETDYFKRCDICEYILTNMKRVCRISDYNAIGLKRFKLNESGLICLNFNCSNFAAEQFQPCNICDGTGDNVSKNLLCYFDKIKNICMCCKGTGKIDIRARPAASQPSVFLAPPTI